MTLSFHDVALLADSGTYEVFTLTYRDHDISAEELLKKIERRSVPSFFFSRKKKTLSSSSSSSVSVCGRDITEHTLSLSISMLDCFL